MSITITNQLSFTKDKISEAFNSTYTATMSVAGYNVQSPPIGTAVTAISTAAISSVGYTFFRSLATVTAATATISIGRYVGTTLHAFSTLRPGETGVLRLASGNYAAQSAVEGSRLLLAILEE